MSTYHDELPKFYDDAGDLSRVPEKDKLRFACAEVDKLRAELKSVSDVLEPINEPVELAQKARNLQAEVDSLRAANADLLRKLADAEKCLRQTSMIEDFLWGRKYCTELYISPCGFHGGEEWQVELNWGDSTTSYRGESVADALSKAIVAAMERKAARGAGGKA